MATVRCRLPRAFPMRLSDLPTCHGGAVVVVVALWLRWSWVIMLLLCFGQIWTDSAGQMLRSGIIFWVMPDSRVS